MDTIKAIDDAMVTAIESYRSGDIEAFTYIYDHTSDKLKKYALYITGNMEDAEDLLQDTYLKILEKADTIRENLAFMSWARTIMYNLFISRCRKQEREFVCEDDALNAFVDEKNTSADPADVVERREISKCVDRAVGALKAQQQDVISEYYYNDKPVKWIAEDTGISEGTVKTRLFYARRELKAKLTSEAVM